MVTEAFIKEVFSVQAENVQKDAPMSAYTTFQIGGPADLLIEPENIESLSKLIKLCRKENVPFMVMGAGSNLLVSDRGIDGVVFRLSRGFDEISIAGTQVIAGAGISLAKLAKSVQRAGLSGLEFASGIPGTLGGAVVMNAGAYGGEMKDVVTEVTYLNSDGEIETVAGEALDFSYRHSVFSGGGKYVLSAKMCLLPKASEKIAETMRELNRRRKEKQPLEKPSAGSVFKRPEGFFAGKLVEDAGLKGVTVGGAGVSEKHAGFIVNNGGATCGDVVELVEKIKSTVQEKFGVTLETEIRVIGR